MNRVELIKEGQSYSRLIAGCMRWGLWGAKLDSKGYLNMINKSLEQGITTFDHADIYGDYTTEAEFGTAFSNSNIPRDSIQLITKCGIRMPSSNRPIHKIKSYDVSSAHIIKSVEQSLLNLKTDYIDLLLIHRPSPLMQSDELAEAFNRLRDAGKVLEFGVSNFTPDQFSLLNSKFELATNQLELSPIALAFFTDGTLSTLQIKGVKPQAWSPLGGQAMFSAQSKAMETERVMRFQVLCKNYGWSLADMALLFLLHHPATISPVLGTANPTRLAQAARLLEMSITDEQWFEIWTASTGIDVA